MTSSIQQSRGPCLICSDNSVGMNFGVLTCMPCKAFFRRNANYEFICPKDGDCLITHTHRRLCNCCRLAKCFRVGMQKELIRSDAEKQARRLLIERNREKKLQIATLQSIQSSHLPPTIHNSSSYLSLSDHTLLSNIFNIFEVTCNAKSASPHYDFPKMQHSSAHTLFNEYSEAHQSTIEYFKRVPEFNTVLIEDRKRLLRNHFGVINTIYSPMVHPNISNNLVVSLTNIFGVHFSKRLLQCIRRVQSFSCDPILLKLFLIIVTFSSGNFRHQNDNDIDEIYDDSLTIFSAQNVYVELLWKYILSRSSTELEAAKFFDKLIQFLLYFLDVHLRTDGYINSLPDEIEKMEPLMQSMWPKAPSEREEISINEIDMEDYFNVLN